MSRRLDVLVVGGGPAGLAAALALRPHVQKIVVIEAGDYERTAVGEHLPPDAQPLLHSLGCLEQVRASAYTLCPGIRSWWGSDQAQFNDYIFNPYGEGWNLDRPSFDGRLLQAAQDAGITIRCRSRITSLERTGKSWSVAAVIDGRKQDLEASFLVDATGRASAVARKLGAERIVHDKQQAIIGWLSASETAKKRETSLHIEAVEDGWWYSIPIPGGRYVAAYMTDPPLFAQSPVPLERLWFEKLMQTCQVRKRLDGCELMEVRVRPASSSRLNSSSGAGWLAVGDAAIAYDPLSSMGILKALRMALVAAGVIQRYRDGDEDVIGWYAAAVKQEFVEYVEKYAFYYQQERRWPEQDFWRRRQGNPKLSSDANQNVTS